MDIANLTIKTTGPVAEIYIDGKKVPRVQAFKVEMNSMEKKSGPGYIAGTMQPRP